MNQKIKVAFFADILVKDFDGASRTMFHIINRIPSDKFEFIFFCGIAPSTEIGHEVIKIPTLSIPFNTTYKLAIPFFSWLTLRKKINTFNPDIIHIASPSPLSDFALFWNKKRKKPVITIYHTHFLSYIDYYLRILPIIIKPTKKAIAYGQKLFYDKSDLIYVPTMQIVAELKAFGFDTSKMKIWQRGINHKVFNPSNKKIGYLNRITNNNKPNIIFTSRLVWEKNLGTLIKIYRESKKNGDLYNFVIAGDGVAKNVLSKKMPEAYFLGKIPHSELSILYASADVFLFPSVSETYGNVVVEAMASGCPCVIAKGGGSQSLVEHGVTGFLCEPKNPMSYLDRIDQIISSDALKQRLIVNGLQYTKQLNWDTLANTYFSDINKMHNKSHIPNKVESR